MATDANRTRNVRRDGSNAAPGGLADELRNTIGMPYVAVLD